MEELGKSISFMLTLAGIYALIWWIPPLFEGVPNSCAAYAGREMRMGAITLQNMSLLTRPHPWITNLPPGLQATALQGFCGVSYWWSWV